MNKEEKQENRVTQRFADAVATDIRETGSELDLTGSGQSPKLGLHDNGYDSPESVTTENF